MRKANVLMIASLLLCTSACLEDNNYNDDDNNGDPCADVSCPGTPASCSGDVAIGAGPEGTCDANSGQCLYLDIIFSERDCAAEGLACRDGECIDPNDLCATVTCDGGDPSCEGDIAYGGYASVCNPETGECEDSPSAPARDCAEEDLTCRDGECIDPNGDICEDVVCEPSPAHCEGNFAIASTSYQCDPDSGECVASTGPPDRDCSFDGLVCLDGRCVDPDDLCADVSCPTSEAFCEDNIAYGPSFSECDPETGECLMAPGVPPRDCTEEGLVCELGNCVEPSNEVTSCANIDLPDDGFTVTDPTLEGTTLSVPVSYSGGCELHLFPACYGMFLDGGENLRVQFNIGHEANNDTCERAVSEVREFDISPVIRAWEEIPDRGDSLQITITGFRGVLTYR
jgi:hypothetical protein